MPTDLADRVADRTGDRPTALVELDGGEIGTVYRVDFADRDPLVAKTGETPLSVESEMLTHLGDAGLPVPAVESATDDLLLLEYVEGDAEISPSVERDAADHLAALHRTTAPAFGFERDTLTGTLRQPNPWTDSWVAFYRDRRLRYAAEVARDAGRLTPALHERVLSVAEDCDALLVEPDAPSLIHGDVWTNNVLARDGRVAAFLDPATYYAHAEVELAYVDWTDTFGDVFFDRYDARRGIDPGFDERRDVYVLYPLLVHVYYFGDPYPDRLAGTLDRLGY
ncbi:fructosamine kinase family protein [Halomicrococcus gelatinilyticus]|uniref:fructosamine kinase family protein n=1 Tax=Halomicrococcus gelatinilyticus TaxID=1702103 RepID=UPI002E124441